MTKQEFETRIKTTVNHEDYRIIEIDTPSRTANPGRKKEKMTAYEKSLNITEFFTVDSTRGNDVFVTYHDASESAIKDAESEWGHLTNYEQKSATVSAWRVIQDNIRPDLVDSDRPWWEATSDRQDLLVKFPDDK